MYLYEQSIIKDINNLFINSKVKAVVADSLDEGLRRIAAECEDKITLPVIVLSGGNWTVDDANFYSLMHGSEIKRVENNQLAKNMSILPITPNYNMYIVAQSSRECDMLTREMLFHYFTHPTLTIDIPYGIDNIHTFNLLFDKNVPKYQNASGLVYRTLGFTLQGAYLWHNNTFNIAKEVTTSVKEVIISEV